MVSYDTYVHEEANGKSGTGMLAMRPAGYRAIFKCLHMRIGKIVL